MKKNIIFSVACAAIMFICSFAVLCPNVDRVVLVENGDLVHTATPVDGAVVTKGKIDIDGRVTATEGSCVIEFPASGGDIECIKVNFNSKYGIDTLMTVESTIDGSFSDVDATYATALEGDDFCCVELERGRYTAVRLWIDTECGIENVSFYDDAPKYEVTSVKISAWRYIATVFIALFAFITMFLLDKKFDLSGKLIAFAKRKYLRICTFVIGSGVAVVLGFVAEIIYRAVFGADSAGNKFNTASCVAFCTVFVCIFIFIFERKNFGCKPEKALFLIILVTGIFVILVQPFSHNSWDIDSHYPWALQNSYYKTAYYTEADLGIKTNSMFVTARTLEESNLNTEALNAADNYAVQSIDAASGVAQKLSGIFIAVARLFGASFYTKYLLGECANLIIYATVCYFAVKKLKSGKMIVSIIALFPTNIFIASNYSYDYWTTSFCLLGTAYFISELEQQDKPITMWETIVMCGAFALAALPKLIYILLLALPMFMQKSWVTKKDKRRYFIILLTIFAVVFAMFFAKSLGTTASSGDSRGGSDVNAAEQVAYILNNPIEYAGTLIKFLTTYLSVSKTKDYISLFAYLGYGKMAYVFLILLFVTVFTDKGKNNSFKGSIWIRILAILMYVGMAALIATALYIDFTPVGHWTVNGCQARYLIPLLAPMMLTVANPGIRMFKNKTIKIIYNAAILAVSTAALIFDLCYAIAIPMM